MAKTSKKKIDNNLKDKSFEILLKKIKCIKNAKDAEIFLDLFFSPIEKQIITRRLAVMILLNQNKKYRDIENILEISRATISKIKQIPSGDGYGRNLQKIAYTEIDKRSKKRKQFSEKLLPSYKGIPSII